MRRTAFWASVGAILYAYLAFPVIVLLRARLFPRPYRSDDITPAVSVIIAAHNAAGVIAAKLANLSALDYPHHLIEIIVASDGSSDETEAIVRGAEDGRVRLISLPRLGKASALNAAIGQATGEILVFSDANSMYAPDAIRALVRPFADPSVGGVAGDQRYRSGRSGGSSDGERRYWDMDRAIKRAESLSGSTISATGAIYAIRRSLADPVAEGVTDDFFLSTGVIARGHRLVFADGAIAYEAVAGTDRGEFSRKVRVMTRGLRGVFLRRDLLDPRRHGFYAIQLLSHKVIRRLVAVPLLILPIASALLWTHGPLYRLATIAQAGFYASGAVGLVQARSGRRTPFGVIAYFCIVNAAALVALSNLIRGRRIDRWQPTHAPEGSGAQARGAER